MLRRIKSSRLLAQNITLMWQMLQTAFQVRPGAVIGYSFGAIGEVSSFIISIFATAKIGGLLANHVAGKATGDIWFWVAVDIAAAAGIGLSFWLMSYNRRLLYFRMVRWATTAFQSALCRIDIADFYDDEMRNKINKAHNGYVWQIPEFSSSVLDLLYALLRFLVTAFVVAQITWWLIPLIALFLMPTLLTESRLAKVQWFVWDTKGDERHIFWGLDWILRQAKNQMELRSLQAREYVLQKIDGLNSSFYRHQEKEYRSLNRLAIPAKLFEVGGTAVGSIIALRQFLSSAISLEKYFFLSGALFRISGALNNIFGTLSRIQEKILFAENFFAVVDAKPKLTDKANAKALSTKKAPVIVFDKVSFTYPGQTEPVFTDLSFSIESGQHIALVGENGAGKSTLIKLLLRFYVPDSGRILIDGQDLQDVSIESWYDRLATLFQDFNQYPLSIAENIEIARPESRGDKKRLSRAAKASRVDHFVKSYPHGWETVLDNSFEKGAEPSGGQWQRIALARAFYRQASVLILDEPTAAIDAKAEYDIFNAIFDHYQDKTAIIVSHRFSTVRRANTIIVIEQGKIIEQGSHLSLMKKKGLYHELFTKQAEGYQA